MVKNGVYCVLGILIGIIVSVLVGSLFLWITALSTPVLIATTIAVACCFYIGGMTLFILVQQSSLMPEKINKSLHFGLITGLFSGIMLYAYFDRSSLGRTHPAFTPTFLGVLATLNMKKQSITAFLTRWLARPPQ
jgi:hypothetical protein